MNQSNHFDVIVLGAGAAGLMCALTAGQHGKRVLVLEKSNKPGKKILMSGGGRCNFTNIYSNPENFISSNPHFCKSALSRYTPWHFIELVNKYEIAYHEKELGQLFCDRSSKDIVNMLLDECANGGADVRLKTDVCEVTYGEIVQIKTEDHLYCCDYLVVATGGLSIPKLGGSGFGYQLAEQLGLTVLPKRAALVPFVFTDAHKKLFSDLSGTSIEVDVQVFENSQTKSFKHQMLFTHRGLSGPSMLQISSYWNTGQQLSINLLPELNDIAESLTLLKTQAPNKTLNQWLSGYWPSKMMQLFMTHLWPEFDHQPVQSISTVALKKLADELGCWVVKPSGTEGYRTAEVTLGGVDTNQLSSQSMASLKHDNVYFIGEVVDVTGHLGGHNFQWAWASGHAAAMDISHR